MTIPKEESNAEKTLSIPLIAAFIDARKSEVDINSHLKGIRKELHPFSSWKKTDTIYRDYKIEKICVEQLEKAATKSPAIRKELQILSLAAKNRAELISEKSDFYPASIPLITSFFAALIIIASESEIVKWGLGLGTVSIFFLFVFVRISTRRQVADLKIIANILDVVEKRLG